MHTPHASISVIGQCCPLPLIELAKAAKQMQPGDVLKITGDDPIFEISVRDFCRALNLEIVTVVNEAPNQTSILIRC
jgi:TusA-related sulfurtransferase